MGAIDYVKVFAQAEGIDLPDPTIRRWVPRRKVQVVAAVRFGILSETEACERYNLTPEEFQSWRNLATRFGVNGVRATRVQHYRTVVAAAE